MEEVLGLVAGLTSVPRYGVFETTLTYPTTGLANPWEQVAVTSTFTTPSGHPIAAEGFYYDVGTYKLRFCPVEVGTYSYSGQVSGPSGTQPFSGSFACVASPAHGFVRRVPGSTYQLQFEDGTFAALAGFNDCWQVNPPPPGQQLGWIGNQTAETDPAEYGPVPLDTYFGKYGDGDGRYNLFRWDPGNCSYGIYQTLDPTGNTYLVPAGQAGDYLLATAKAHGFHVLFAFFNNCCPPFGNVADGTPEAASLKRYFRYAFARYGAFVDIWEMANESTTTTITDAWLVWTTTYIRSIDPYVRLITNSNPRPTDPNYLDVQSPHWYGGFSDLYNQAPNKTGGIPTVSGEAGALNDPIGASALYQQDFQRVQLWTGIFGRTGIAWWLSFYNAYPNTRNMYIGSKGRLTNSVLQGLVANLSPTAQSRVLNAPSTNAYGLGDTATSLAYLTRDAGPHASAPTTLSLNVPFTPTSANWIDPATGTLLGPASVVAGNQTLPTPTFTTDVALVVRGAVGCTDASQCPPCGPCQARTCVGGVCGCQQAGCTDVSQCPACPSGQMVTCVNCVCGCVPSGGCTDPSQCPSCPGGLIPTCVAGVCGCGPIILPVQNAAWIIGGAIALSLGGLALLDRGQR